MMVVLLMMRFQPQFLSDIHVCTIEVFSVANQNLPISHLLIGHQNLFAQQRCKEGEKCIGVAVV